MTELCVRDFGNAFLQTTDGDGIVLPLIVLGGLQTAFAEMRTRRAVGGLLFAGAFVLIAVCLVRDVRSLVLVHDRTKNGDPCTTQGRSTHR